MQGQVIVRNVVANQIRQELNEVCMMKIVTWNGVRNSICWALNALLLIMLPIILVPSSSGSYAGCVALLPAFAVLISLRIVFRRGISIKSCLSALMIVLLTALGLVLSGITVFLKS